MRRAFVLGLCALALPALAADLPARAARLAPGGSIGAVRLMIQMAKQRSDYVVMPAGSAWESADTMWLSLGKVYVSRAAWFGFHEGENCPDGPAGYGGVRCTHSVSGTAMMRANVPACVRRLGDYWHVWDGPQLRFFTGAAILAMCAGDPTIHRLD